MHYIVVRPLQHQWTRTNLLRDVITATHPHPPIHPPNHLPTQLLTHYQPTLVPTQPSTQKEGRPAQKGGFDIQHTWYLFTAVATPRYLLYVPVRRIMPHLCVHRLAYGKGVGRLSLRTDEPVTNKQEELFSSRLLGRKSQLTSDFISRGRIRKKKGELVRAS